MIVLLMGVAGAGKTTVGAALASAVGWQFSDADSFHSAANVEKMSHGIPLTDEDRAPWLEALRHAIVRWIAAGDNVVLACSALKESYRERLMVGPEVKLVYLHGSAELIATRLANRHEHYMQANMLASQLATLEEPKDALVADISQPVEEIVRWLRIKLNI